MKTLNKIEISNWLKNYSESFSIVASNTDDNEILDFMGGILKEFCIENNLPYMCADELQIKLHKESKLVMRFMTREDWMGFAGAIPFANGGEPLLGEMRLENNKIANVFVQGSENKELPYRLIIETTDEEHNPLHHYSKDSKGLDYLCNMAKTLKQNSSAQEIEIFALENNLTKSLI